MFSVFLTALAHLREVKLEVTSADATGVCESNLIGIEKCFTFHLHCGVSYCQSAFSAQILSDDNVHDVCHCKTLYHDAT